MALQEEMEKQGNWLFKYRSYLPLIILLIGLIIFIHTEIHPQRYSIRDTPYETYYEMFALFISLIGQFIRVYTVGYSAKNTSGRNTKVGQIADSINTTGVYSIVRHPLYLGNFFMWFGIAMLTTNLWFIIVFILLYWIYYERIMFSEEQFLRRKFGKEYLEWSENIPAFIPKLKDFKKPDYPFNWKKVLRNEKNGIFAVFFVFCFFDILDEVINKTSHYNYFLIVMTLITAVAYVVLKYLKKRTILLNEVN